MPAQRRDGQAPGTGADGRLGSDPCVDRIGRAVRRMLCVRPQLMNPKANGEAGMAGISAFHLAVLATVPVLMIGAPLVAVVILWKQRNDRS
jgi:hypothetical protein